MQLLSIRRLLPIILVRSSWRVFRGVAMQCMIIKRQARNFLHHLVQCVTSIEKGQFNRKRRLDTILIGSLFNPITYGPCNCTNRKAQKSKQTR